MNQPTLTIHASQSMRMMTSLIQVLSDLGIRCQFADHSIEKIATGDETHLIWGMEYHPQSYRAFGRQDNIYFMENGWFTQHTGCYIDKRGPNAMSSICNALGPRLCHPEMTRDVREFIDDLHSRVGVAPVTDEGDYIFVPLQVEHDTQIKYWSGCQKLNGSRQAWFLDKICSVFHDRKIIVRPHPRDRGIQQRLEARSPAVANHFNLQFRSEGSSYDWVAGAEAVVGINSTVLLEALTFFKPVCAFGQGVFTGNQVVVEHAIDPDALLRIHTYQPDPQRIVRFIHLLMQRHIPYRLRPADIDQYPVLGQMIRHTLGVDVASALMSGSGI